MSNSLNTSNQKLKSIFTAICLLASLLIHSQNAEYNAIEEEVRGVSIGTWNLKGSDYKSQFIFSEEEGQLICTINQYLDEEPSPGLTHRTTVEISSNDSIIQLNWDYQKFFWKGRIEKLKSRRMLVEINGRNLAYIKK